MPEIWSWVGSLHLFELFASGLADRVPGMVGERREEVEMDALEIPRFGNALEKISAG
jgi:hypothetical protein